MKSEGEREASDDITYVWNLKYDKRNLSTKQKQTHRQENGPVVAEGGDVGEGWI